MIFFNSLSVTSVSSVVEKSFSQAIELIRPEASGTLIALP